MKEYSTELYNHVKSYLTKDHWEFTETNESGMLHTSVKLKSEVEYLNLLIDIHESYYQVYACLHTLIPEQARGIVAEKINEINSTITFGHFEYGNDGDLRYRYVVVCENNLPTEQTLHNSLYVPPYIVDFYGPKILGIIQQFERTN